MIWKGALLALQDLRRDWLFAVCNAAVIFGVLLPLLVLTGIKGGIFSALLDDLRRDPATLRIDTVGNRELTSADVQAVSAMPGTRFVIGRTRSFFDDVNVRPAAGGSIASTVILPTAAGDPFLPPEIRGAGVAHNQVALTAALADQLDLHLGDTVQIVTAAEARPRQLLVEREIVGILDALVFPGRTILVDPETAEDVEAFYEGFAVPEAGITDGRDPSGRGTSFEALRVHATDLAAVAGLQTAVEAALGVETRAQTDLIRRTMTLGHRLDVALTLLGAIAATGLVAALGFAFWSSVERKRSTLAVLALVGLQGPAVAVFPVTQAVATALVGVGLSFVGYGVCANIAGRMFPDAVPDGARLAIIDPKLGAILAIGVVVLAAVSSLVAAVRAARVSPAVTLRAIS